MPQKRRDSDSSGGEGEELKYDQDEVHVRQDLYVVFTHERELKSVDQIRMKICQFTGIVMRCKSITAVAIENLLNAIEQDALNFQQLQSQLAQQPRKIRMQAAPIEMGGLQESAPLAYQTPTSGIVNLRFEECQLTSKAVQLLKTFLSTKQLIETFFISKVEFQDPVADFRCLMEGLQFSIKIRKVGVLGQLFDEEPYGKILSHLLNDCRQLREFDVSQSEFFHPKCFFDMCQAFISEKCRVTHFKLRGLHITNLEGKVLQFVLMKNKTLHTLDISNAKIDSSECLDFFFQKLDKHSQIRYLILDGIQPDISNSLEVLGEALSENNKLEVLIMRENRIKWIQYANFWESLKTSNNLQKINVSKTDLSDRVMEKMCGYLFSQEIRLVDLDLSRNQITDVGLTNLSETLMNNTSIKFLNLSQNLIKDVGLRQLVQYLSSPNCVLVELSLMGNKISNEGIHILSEFIKPNTSLKMLDISRNLYSDNAFLSFASEMGVNATLTFLDISKSKDLNDEGSLITLARQLAFNSHLQTLDLTGVRVRKPFLKLYLEPSLKKNITLKYVIGKLTPDVIDEQLNINIQIQTDVEPNFTQNVKTLQKGQFNVRNVDPTCTSFLNMKDSQLGLFDAVFKFIQQKDVRQLDLSNMGLTDGQLYQLAQYISTVPNLRSLVLNGNSQITDDGINRISQALSKNTKLTHLSFKNCQNLTNECLVYLINVIQNSNLMFYAVEFDEDRFDKDLAKQVKREMMLNKAIQENLQPSFFCGKQNMSRPKSAETAENDDNSDKLQKEVVFKPDAQVHKHLFSAIKCWRISQPIIIQIENQQLNDKHIKELCGFLKDRDMITNLNLRRNRITNVGALSLIEWMLLHDKALTSLDVSRNRITRAGGQAFLTALKKLTRILDFQIAYGNPIPLEISLAISYEIQANNQIKANKQSLNQNANSKMTLTNGKYELNDRGPTYIRCAIKSVELLRITHLSLPDNMLGLEEAKMLAAMIKLNPPLKQLNLETNNLDAQCAKLIGDALYSNSNLQILNISKNKLSDLGINYLLKSLIKQSLFVLRKKKEQEKKEEKKEQEAAQTQQPQTVQSPQNKVIQPRVNSFNIQKTSTNSQNSNPSQLNKRTTLFTPPVQIVPVVQEKEEVNQLLLTEEIEKCEMGQLKILNIIENYSTIESYKSIWTLLKINPQIVLYFDSPTQIKQNFQQHEISQQKKIRYQKLQEQSLEETARNLINDTNDIEDPELSDDENSQLESFRPITSTCHSYLDPLLNFCKKITCYKNEQTLQQINLNNETFLVVLFWQILKWKHAVTEFQANPVALTQFDQPSVQNTIAVLLVVNQAILYIFALLPYFISDGPAAVVQVVFVGIMVLAEFIVLLTGSFTVKISLINPYLWLQILSGILKKSVLLALALVGGICAQTSTQGGILLGVVLLISIIIQQYSVLQTLIKLKSVEDTAVLPYIERSQKVAEVLNYEGLVIFFGKITLLPSKNSELLSQKIALDLNPDLIKPPAEGVLPRIWELLNLYLFSTKLKRHLLFIDFALIIAILLSLLFQLAKFEISLKVCIALLIIDLTSCLIQLSDSENQTSLDQSKVYIESIERKTELNDRYIQVLTREPKVQIIDSEVSIFEADEQIIEFDESNKQEQLPAPQVNINDAETIAFD